MNKPIGFFDSGIGGTSIWKEVTQLLPNEDTVYLADSKNAPYGTKSKEKIIELCKKNTELLLKKNCKLIIVACNTATTNAISILREKYSIPFIGIEPAIKPAGLVTKTRKIGVLATKGTLNSELFEKTSQKLDKDIKIIKQIGNGLVELIEANKIDTLEMKKLLFSYLQPMLNTGIDALVLGCTHYLYLIPLIEKLLEEDIKIIDSGLAVAKQTEKVLKINKIEANKSNNATYKFYMNTNAKTLKNMI